MSGRDLLTVALIRHDVGSAGVKGTGQIYADVLERARALCGAGENRPHAAIMWVGDNPFALEGNRFEVREMTHQPHGLMLHALLNALPAADISLAEPLVINDTLNRADFENVCPVRFLAMFPMVRGNGETAGYLVLYDVKPRELQAGAYTALKELAGEGGQLDSLN